jgi:hypothetical protein
MTETTTTKEFDTENSGIQTHMDTFYERWQADNTKSQKEMLVTATPQERISVIVGNLNYQVGNGGFQQWVDNGYFLNGAELLNILSLIADYKDTTPEEKAVTMELKDKVGRLLSHTDLHAKDRGFGGNYWLDDNKDRHGYLYEGDEGFDDEQNEGQAYAESLDSWYYEKVEDLFLAAADRFVTGL